MLTLDLCPPTRSNPRHDHQLIFPLSDRRLLLVWSEYYATRPSEVAAAESAPPLDDNVPCRISARISTDRGRSWSESFTIQDNVGAMNVKHPNLLRLPSHEILFFFTVWNHSRERLVLLKRSADEGEHWSAPVRVSTRPGFNNVNNDHVLRLGSGRIVLPAFVSPVIWEAGEHFVAFCYLSDDDGRSWRAGAASVDLPRRGAEEPSVVALTDGRLLMMLRTSLGQLYRAVSADGGETWSVPEPTGLASPAAPPLLKRMPDGRRLLLIWNEGYDASHSHQGERSVLAAAVSEDEGLGWRRIRDVDRVPGGAASYASVTFDGGEAFVSYYYQERGIGGRSGIRLRIVPPDWLGASS